MTREDDLHTRILDWFEPRLPADWLASPAQVELEVDNDEILLVLPLAERIDPGQFRHTTRHERIALAAQAQETFGRRVSWGTVAGGTRRLFTTVRAVVAAQLAMPERRILDSLVAAGVASDRSDALRWCVRLVGQHEVDWLRDLHDGLAAAAGAPIERPVQI